MRATIRRTEKYALFGEIVAYLRLVASIRPIVMVLEDLQWADPATWDVLEHVMSQLDHDRILICATMRSEDTRGEALERRNRLLRDERFSEIGSRDCPSRKLPNGSRVCSAAKRAASCSRICCTIRKAIRSSRHNSFEVARRTHGAL